MRMGETLVGVLRLEELGPSLDGTRVQETAVIEAVAELGALVLERERLLRDREEARASELALRGTQTEMDLFLGIAAHELKTPLTSLKLALQLGERRLRRLVEAEPDRAENLAPFQGQVEQVAHQVGRLDRLVNDLLDASRARVGRLDLHPEPTDLVAIVDEAVEQQREANPTRTLTFPFPADQRVPITADPDRIGQVVTNYLTNALKYSAEDRPVVVGLEVEAEQARVWVRDLGPGLPAEELELIWERFHRAKGIEVQSGSGVGLGLGLHICRMIIERHQGQVGIQSAPGQGSTLWFTLPL
jgi:signal transduction histidine kinase